MAQNVTMSQIVELRPHDVSTVVHTSVMSSIQRALKNRGCVKLLRNHSQWRATKSRCSCSHKIPNLVRNSRCALFSPTISNIMLSTKGPTVKTNKAVFDPHGAFSSAEVVYLKQCILKYYKRSCTGQPNSQSQDSFVRIPVFLSLKFSPWLVIIFNVQDLVRAFHHSIFFQFMPDLVPVQQNTVYAEMPVQVFF